MATVPADVEGPSDADLIESVRKGTVSAYGSLYERHVASAYNLARQLSRSPAEADDLVSEAFAKVLDTLRAGRGPDSAFRAYLLTTLRHTAYDKTRRDRKVELSDDVSTVSGVSAEAVSQQFEDPAVIGLDRSMAAQAFARLPERWQAVLWHTEIEGQSPAEVGPILGLTANGVSALAYRAREGLRQAYLQVHLAETTDRQCRVAAERLGAWTRGGLAKREKAQVEAHLDTCERCRALAAELADVNGAMRGYVAPLVLGIGAMGYLATTGVAQMAALTTAAGATGAAGVVGAAGAAPRQFLGVAASTVALAAAIVVGLTAGGERPAIPAAAPVPSQEQEQEQQPEQPPRQPPPVVAEPPPRQPPPATPPAQQESPAATPTPPPSPAPPAPQPPAAPPRLDASGPVAPISLIGGGAPVDLPLTVRNTGGTVSAPVTAVLALPAGVTAIPVDGLAAPRLLSLNGAKAGTVDCPGGVGTVTCVSEAGLAPGESVTLLFRLVAAENSRGGVVTGAVSAGTSMNISVSVRVNVTPPAVTDGVQLAAEADFTGLLGLWFRPVVEVTVTNTGTSSRPVTLVVDRPGQVRWSSQELTCTTAGGTTCVTTAEVAPGEKLKAVFQIDPHSWSGHPAHGRQVTVAVTLGGATDSAQVTLWPWLWPIDPPTTTTPPPPSVPPTTGTPTEPTESAEPPTTVPPTGENPRPGGSQTTPPPTTTTPPTTTPPGSSPTPPAPPQPPSEPDPPSGGLGGLLGWLLGG